MRNKTVDQELALKAIFRFSCLPIVAILIATCFLGSCGGGGSEPPPTYSVGGSVSGLTGTGLELQVASGGSVQLTAIGVFTFPVAFANGSSYSVSVTAQPTSPPQTCRVSPTTSSGTINQSDVTSVIVNCGSNPARFVYTVNSGSNSISAFSVNGATGALTAISGSPYPTGTDPTAITINPQGSTAYVSNQVSSDISAFAIAAETGSLADISGSPFAISPFVPASGKPISQVAMDPSGKFAFVTNGNAPFIPNTVQQTDNFFAFNVNLASGVLSPVAGSPFSTGGLNPVSVLVHPSGKYAYVLNLEQNASADQPGITVFAIDAVNDTVTLVAGSPFAPFGNHDEPASFLINPNGTSLYGAAPINGQIIGSTINTTTGALGPAIETLSALGNLSSMATDHAGRFFYVTTPGMILSYSIGSNGSLTYLNSSIFSASEDPEALVIDPTDKYVYAADTDGIYLYTIGSDGGLTLTDGSPFATSDALSALTIDPSIDYLYASSSTKNTISVFYINPSSGTLTEVVGSPFPAGTTPGQIAVVL